MKSPTNLQNTHATPVSTSWPTYTLPLFSYFSPKQGPCLTLCPVPRSPHSTGRLPHTCHPSCLITCQPFLYTREWHEEEFTCKPLQNPNLLYPSFGRYSAVDTHAQLLILSSVSITYGQTSQRKKSKFPNMEILSQWVGPDLGRRGVSKGSTNPYAHQRSEGGSVSLAYKAKIIFSNAIWATTMANITSKSSKSFPEFIVALSHLLSQQTDIKIATIWKGYCEFLTFKNVLKLRNSWEPLEANNNNEVPVTSKEVGGLWPPRSVSEIQSLACSPESLPHHNPNPQGQEPIPFLLGWMKTY